MTNKLFLLLSSIILIFSNTFAQKNALIGATLGTSYYLGDVNTKQQFYSPRVAFGLLYKLNLGNHYALKFSGNKMKLTGDDKDFSSTAQILRDHRFSTDIYDFSGTVEFNFFPYSLGSAQDFISPYVFGGIGFLYATPAYEGFSSLSATLPFGLGLKASFNKRVEVGICWTLTKTNTDGLDNLKPTFEEGEFAGRQKTYFNNNDWYSFAGIYLAYRFYDRMMQCPAYGTGLKTKKW